MAFGTLPSPPWSYLSCKNYFTSEWQQLTHPCATERPSKSMRTDRVMWDDLNRAALCQWCWLLAVHRDATGPQGSGGLPVSAGWVCALLLPPGWGEISRRHLLPLQERAVICLWWVWCHHSQSSNCKIHQGERNIYLLGGRTTTPVCKYGSVSPTPPQPQTAPTRVQTQGA